MVNRTHVVFSANDRSYFAILKKEIHLLAVSANFNEKKVAEIDIIVAEMVSNLVKHAGGGRLLVRLMEEDHLQGMEIISVDDGPGMTDITRMVADGVSTKNTLGQGLGAIKRLSDTFQVFSRRRAHLPPGSRHRSGLRFQDSCGVLRRADFRQVAVAPD